MTLTGHICEVIDRLVEREKKTEMSDGCFLIPGFS